MAETEMPVILKRMNSDSRAQLAEDVSAYGAEILASGLGRRRIADKWPHLGAKRADRLAAYMAGIRRGDSVPMIDVENKPAEAVLPQFEQHPDFGADEDIEDLVKRLCEDSDRRIAKKMTCRIARSVLPDDKPFALCFMGDQHIDDPYCNRSRWVRDLQTIRETGGMYCINLGDITNNWVGRLKELYAHQGVTQDQTERLLLWALRQVPYLVLQLGNHDLWNNGGSLIRLVYELTGNEIGRIVDYQCNLELVWPSGEKVRVVTRHSFKGSSIYNKTHGPKRASLFDGGWGDIYMQGHTHESAVAKEMCDDGRYRVFGKAGGYKNVDAYADKLGFSQHLTSGCQVVICNQDAPDEDRFTTMMNVQEAAKRLADLRRE